VLGARAFAPEIHVERRQADARVASLQLDVAQTIRQAARQVRSTAEREDAARAGAALAEQRGVRGKNTFPY